MTGYAVTFNKRHKRSGHLFQNRYKSVVCEQDPYLLELIRYIHLNPLRASLVNDLKELDSYPWSGHSAMLGRRKNPLVPNNLNKSNEVDKSLAEKTVEDVLLQFDGTLRKARRRYREFVEKGIAQGTRHDLQGGGLVRSAGGKKAGLLGRKKEERELFDARVLGSGDFVADVMKERAGFSISLPELVARICSRFEITVDELVSKRRKRTLSQARAVLCYLATDELGYSGEDVARTLGISGRAVGDCRDRGKKVIAKRERISEYLV